MKKLLYNTILKSESADRRGYHQTADRMLCVASNAMKKLPGLVPPVLDAIFTQAGAQLFCVGGAVRDALLGNKPKDIDLCTDFTPDQMIALCKQHNLHVIPTGIDHGTLTIMADGEPIEVTTFRADVETDGRHAKVGFVKDINEDLSRRDFTINAMAVDAEGNLVDPFNGTQDLADGTIRAVGDPQKRFSEDFLRIIRAARFASRYGFTIEPQTAQAMIDMGPELTQKIGSGVVAIERVVDEFSKSFKTNNAMKFIEIMNDLGVLSKIIPNINNDIINKFKLTIDKIPQQYKWCALFMWMQPNQVDQAARVLRIPLDIVPVAQKCAEIRPILENMMQSEVSEVTRRNFQALCGNYFDQLSEIFRSLYNSSDIINYIFNMNIDRFSPILQGRDIVSPNKKPGKWVGEALRDAEQFQKDRFVQTGENPSREEILDYIKKHLE